jgi:hypothetical protein
MLAVYLVLIHSEGDRPAIWFVTGLAVAALLAAYGVRWGVTALVVAGVLMLGLGLLGIFSVGLPIIVAGVLALAAAGRRRLA